VGTARLVAVNEVEADSVPNPSSSPLPEKLALVKPLASNVKEIITGHGGKMLPPTFSGGGGATRDECTRAVKISGCAMDLISSVNE